jgi:hypothetical protein
MSIVPSKQSHDAAAAESVEQRFRRLADAWLAETAFVSSSSEVVAHPAFEEIVKMGRPVIPFVLRELENGPGHWHRALRRITGIDLATDDNRGDSRKLAEAWLRWGRAQDYEW